MAEIGLVEAIASLREELAEAVKKGDNRDIQFLVGNIDLEFQVGVIRDVRGGSNRIGDFLRNLGGSRIGGPAQ